MSNKGKERATHAEEEEGEEEGSLYEEEGEADEELLGDNVENGFYGPSITKIDKRPTVQGQYKALQYLCCSVD